MAVNGPATEDGILHPETKVILEGSPGHDPMLAPITWTPETDTFERDPMLIQIRPPERPY